MIENKKGLSQESAFKIANAIGLSFEKQKYFDLLVCYAQASSIKEKRYYKSWIDSFRKDNFDGPFLSKKVKLLDKWYYPVILVTSDKLAVKGASKRLHYLTHLPEKVVQRTLEYFVEHQLIDEKNGFYYISKRYLSFYDKLATKKSHKEFLRQQLHHSLKQLERNYHLQAKFFSHSFTISEDRYQYYVDKIDSLIDQISAESDSEQIEKVIQLNIQIFPMA